MMTASSERDGFLVRAAKALSASGRTGSAETLLADLAGRPHPLPVLRGIVEAHFDLGAEEDSPDARNWADYGCVPTPRLRCLCILDEISELVWSNEFDCVPLSRSNAMAQIAAQDYDFILLETAWLGHKGEWAYAFTSQNMQHPHAMHLATILTLIRTRFDKPIIMINKEDPLHFDRFLPAMAYADHIFTSDENMVSHYRERVPALSVNSMAFAADMSLANPVGRVFEPQESVCFAGSFYSGEYYERTRQLNYMLQPILDFDGVIYDRQSANVESLHPYPDRFQPFIRPAVEYRDMFALYRRFKVFLNVNTVVSSPTMMSRRVYELLASGTPVVSASSQAIETQFSGIIPTVSTAQEASQEVERLLSDEEHWWKTSQKGIRKIALHHQVRHRGAALISAVWGSNRIAEKALVSIVIVTDNPIFLERICNNVACQNYPRVELILIAGAAWSNDELIFLERRIASYKRLEAFRVERRDYALNAKPCVMNFWSFASGSYLGAMCQSSFYFDNYVTDMMICFGFTVSCVITKLSFFSYDGVAVRLNRSPFEHSYTCGFESSAIIFSKERLKDSHAGLFDLEGFASSSYNLLELDLYSADRFNFIKFDPTLGNGLAVDAGLSPLPGSGGNLFGRVIV